MKYSVGPINTFADCVWGCKPALPEAGDPGEDLAERKNLEGRRGGVPKGGPWDGAESQEDARGVSHQKAETWGERQRSREEI